MKSKILIILILLLMPFCAAHSKIEVLKVFDGDLILAKIENNIFTIRLNDIDCFEAETGKRAKKQAKEHKLTVDETVKGGNLARDYLRSVLENQNVSFEFQGVDKYSRALGTLYIENKNVNELMLKTPYCYPCRMK